MKSLASTRSDFQILLGCRDVHKGEVAVSEMGAPVNVNPIQIDVTDDTSIEHAVKAVEQHFGRLDILINNAGTAGSDLLRDGGKPTLRQTYQHVYNVNVIGTGVLTDNMIPLLQQSKDPRIIFISSITGSIGTIFNMGKMFDENILPYSSSKTAVNMMAVHYAHQYPNIKVNAVCPGYRGTALNGASPEGDQHPSLGAVNAVRLATETKGTTATYTNTEGTIPW